MPTAVNLDTHILCKVSKETGKVSHVRRKVGVEWCHHNLRLVFIQCSDDLFHDSHRLGRRQQELETRDGRKSDRGEHWRQGVTRTDKCGANLRTFVPAFKMRKILGIQWYTHRLSSSYRRDSCDDIIAAFDAL